jgi:DNA primase
MSVDIAKHRIIQQVPLANLIGERLQLTSRSGRLMGCCPFHQEKTPSFMVFDDHYHCFGCGAHGDAIDFTRHDQGLGFIETLRYLAQKYGIEAPELQESQQQRQKYGKEALYYQIHAEAQKIFIQNLRTPYGQTALQYLKSRGFTDERIESFQFGLSLEDPFALTRQLTKMGFRPDDLVACSLANRSDKSQKYYDFFQHRIMIPIADRHGRVIGFGGRTLGDDPAKYKNSRETPIFDKSSTMFGLNYAMTHIKQQGFAMIVEGYMDTLQMWNHGFSSAVACMGTAVSLQHLRQISNLTKQLYLVFDGDKAGQRANLRTVSTALELPQLAVKVIRLPVDEDPDSFLQHQGAEKLKALMQHSRDLLDYAIENTLQETHGLGLTEALRSQLVPWLRTVNDRINYSYLVNRIASFTSLPFDEIDRLVKTPQVAETAARPQKIHAERTAEVKKIELPGKMSVEFEALAHIFFSQPGELDETLSHHLLTHELSLDDSLRTLGLRMIEMVCKGNHCPADTGDTTWLFDLPPHLLELINELKESRSAFAGLARNTQLLRISRHLKLKKLKKTRSQLKNALCHSGSKALSNEEMVRIMHAINEVNKEISKLESSGN